MRLSKDEVALLVDSGKAHRASLTATSKKRTHTSRTSCLPSTIAGPKAPGEDVPPLCGPLTHRRGRPREACSWVRTHWSLDSPQGQPPGGPRRLPSAGGRSEPPADGGAVHTSREVGSVPTGCRAEAAGLRSRFSSPIHIFYDHGVLRALGLTKVGLLSYSFTVISCPVSSSRDLCAIY